jgi:2-methylfumaryl-CoA hydratase
MSELRYKVSKKHTELAPDTQLALPDQVKRPEYGRVLEDFEPGQVFTHPRGLTIDRAFAIEFAQEFMEANPLYLNQEFARAHGYRDVPVSPLMVMNVALSLGVQNDSEKAVANLGYYDMHFLKTVYPGDTLTAKTKVLDRKERGDKAGIVTIRTIGLNQAGALVLQYDRKIMVAPAGKKSAPTTVVGEDFPDTDEPQLEIPVPGLIPKNLTGTQTYFEDFNAGDVIVHRNGRTVTEEHIPWTYRMMNTHPLHYDRLYSTGREGPMSGEPIVYGGLAFAWLCGLAGRDISENALWDLGYTEGYHTQPLYAGETIAALSRVLKKAEGPNGLNAGVVTLQLIGVKEMTAAAALDQYGAELFEKENLKKKAGKKKIEKKIFEIERRLLIKKRPSL